MKIEVKENAVFQPIELKLVIETEEELCDLWHRLNAGSNSVNKGSSKIKYEANDCNYELWNQIDKFIKKYNLNDEAE